jgi:heavy metal sensor kinase
MRSVSARLTFLFALLTGAILAGFSATLYLWLRDSLERDLDKELDIQARLLQERFVEEYDEVQRGIHADLSDELTRFLDAAGTLGEIRRAGGATVFASAGGVERPGHRVRGFSFSDARGAAFEGRVSVAESVFLAPLRQFRRYFLVFFPLVMAVAGIAGHLFVRRALTPVELMRRQAEQISRTNVSERVPEPASTGEFRDLARTFNEMLDRLERGIQDLQNFAADAAHELRTPLATLRAEIETAIQERRSPEEYERVLASLAEEVSRMSRIVTDLFMLAKLDMRQYALQKERVRLRPLLEDARETWQAAASQRGIEIAVEGEDAEVAGDPVALRRVFMNLVENSVKYNREGGRVSLRVDRENGRARVRVVDTGIGIPADSLSRLFHRFYRVDRARSRESGGAGLGLAICRSFVEAHEGTIAVQSEPGRGTTFTVELPAA